MRKIRRFTVVAALAVATAMLSVALPAKAVTTSDQGARVSTTGQPSPSSTFYLINYSPGFCLDIRGGADDQTAAQGYCNEAADQTWNVGAEAGISGYYELINGDGECLGVSNASTAPGAAIVAWQCLGHKDQYWAWAQSAINPSYHYLVNYNSGKVVSVANNSASNDAPVVQEPTQAKPNGQIWDPYTSVQSPQTPTQPAGPWVGYSAYPASGYVIDSEATWNVPQISNCPFTVGAGPRTAAWVGLWGGTTSMQDKTGWLPQIGTDSVCLAGQPYYLLTWQMYAQDGGGNGEQYGYDCSAGQDYNVCGDLPEIDVPLLGEVAFVNPGDLVNAAVYDEGPYGSTPTQRTFEIRLDDETTGQYVQGTITTNQAVSLGNIARQGGAIVEDDSSNGLAQFNPLTFSDVYAGGGSGGYSFFHWAMQFGSDQLAITSSPSISYNSSTVIRYGYTVTWKHTT